MSDGGGKSLIVSGDAIHSDARGIELVIFVTLAIGFAWLSAEVLSMAISKIAENSGRARRFIEAINQRTALIPRFKTRRAGLQKIVDQRNEGVATLDTGRKSMSNRLKKIKGTSDYLVREIGSDLVGTRCYTFSVSNRYVTEYVSKGQKHPLLDDSWKSGQLVEVWSKSLMDARIVIADRYPATAGYVVEMLKDKDASASTRK